MANKNNEPDANTRGTSRAQRLFQGWSASLVQMLLGVSQQILLVPIFLQYWSSTLLAAWLAIYAAASLVLVADGGLQLRATNRFLAFKSSADPDGRSGRFYGLMLRAYLWLVTLVAVVLVIGAWLLPPSAVLRFDSTSHFDAAFTVMTVGTLTLLPSNLSLALYRARGCYGRAIWIQSFGMMAAQVAQLLAVVTTRNLLAVSFAYVVMQLLSSTYLVVVDAPRQFPFVRLDCGAPQSWRWYIGQFRRGLPFGFAGATDMALLNAPVLLVSSFVSDRVAVAQWALIRVLAGLVRMLCVQLTIPLAAELGHDYAVGAKGRLGHLYAQGTASVTLVASVVAAGVLVFCPDFFSLWTHGSIPYDPWLGTLLLLGASAAAPSIVALGFANCSNRGDLLVRSKSLQLVLFAIMSIGLIPHLGALGAAVAIVTSELVVQFGILTLTILQDTVRRPFRYAARLLSVSFAVIAFGWAIGAVIRKFVSAAGVLQFIVECGLWLIVIGVIASPLAYKRFRAFALAAISS